MSEELEVTFDLSTEPQFDAEFVINAAGTTWGSIDGDIADQTDLKDALDTIDGKIEVNTNDISTINTTISDYGNIVTHNVSEFATASQGALADTALQPNDNISELNNNVGYITGSYVNDATLTIQRNGTNVATFTANSATNQIANILVPTTATEVGALPSTTTINDLTTTAQQNALNSGVTSSVVNQVGTNTTNIASNTSAISANTTAIAGNTSTLATHTSAIASNTSTLAVHTSAIASNTSLISQNTSAIATNTSSISIINDKIPAQATSSNQLADKNFVNSSIATNTANFIGTFNSVAELEAYSGTVTNNDYAFVIGTDSAGNTVYDRYKYTDATTPASWEYEYTLNNSSFTSDQWAAINSGITSSDVSLIGTALQPNDNISELVNNVGYITSASLPTVNNGNLTIKVNGTSVGTFTANQSGDTTASITVPTDTTDLINGAGYITSSALNGYATETWVGNQGYITGITSSDVTTALGYTPYNSTNPNGYITSSALAPYALSSSLATVATSGNYNDLSNKPTIPTVNNATLTIQKNGVNVQTFTANASSDATANITVPTDVSDLTNTTLANKDLGNLSTIGEARLHALKSYEDAGELLTDGEGLTDVKEYAHSTFDLSKFTVVGSPNITDDGIASGFTTSDYLKTSMQLSALAGKSWRIEDNFTVAGNLIDYTLNLSEDLQGFGNITSSLNGLYFSYYIGDISDYDFGTVSLSPIPNGTYKYFLEFDITTSLYTLGYSNLDGSDIHALTITPTKANKELFTINTRPNQHIMIGNRLDYAAVLPTDLKQLSIKADEAPIFSGNKTGIDTIKPDNYTVVGTPVITDDGILVQATSANYLLTPTLTFSNNNNVDIEVKINVSSISGGAQTFGGTNGTRLEVYNNSSTEGWTVLSFQEQFVIAITSVIPLNQDVWLKIHCRGANSYVEIKIGNSDYQITSSTVLFNNAFSINEQLKIGTFNNKPSNCNIDLNSFKFYVDDNLVYQPCLKIPYTESKTGSKIADSVYRDRVIDMYNQFGYAPYYTLSNTDFTLPQGELYGMMLNQSTPHIVETYVNGTSWYRVWSDGWCEQGGYVAVTELGGNITFLKSYKDTNYSILLGDASNGGLVIKFDENGKGTSGMWLRMDVWSSERSGGAYWCTKGYIS